VASEGFGLIHTHRIKQKGEGVTPKRLFGQNSGKLAGWEGATQRKKGKKKLQKELWKEGTLTPYRHRGQTRRRVREDGVALGLKGEEKKKKKIRHNGEKKMWLRQRFLEKNLHGRQKEKGNGELPVVRLS